MTARDTTTQDATTPSDPTDEVGSPDPAATPVDLEKSAAPDEPGAPDDTPDAPESESADTTDTAGTPADDEPAAAKASRKARRKAKAERTHRGHDAAPAAGRRRWPLVALLLVGALFAGAMAVLYLVTRPADVAGLTKPQQAAVDAASQAAVNLQTFRRASFDQDFANALASLTPEFAKEQLAPRKDALQKQLTAGGRDATATVLSAGLVSSTSSQAVVLVVTNTTQTADNGQSTPFVFSRLQLTLQLTGGKWLVSDLQSVGLS